MKCALEGNENLSVGKVFELKCEADSPSEFSNLKLEQLEIRLEKADQYKLQILKSEQTSADQLRFEVVSYKAGEHQLKALQVVDGEHSLVLGDLSFAVSSVMNQQEPEKEPYPSVGAFSVHVPLWYWLLAFALLASILSWVYWRVRERKQKQKLMREMNLESIAQNPVGQFFHSVRKMQRSYAFFSGIAVEPSVMKEFIEELNQAYRIYLARNFEVPALQWSEGKILSDIKKNYRSEYAELRPVLRKGLAELSRAQKNSDKVSSTDAQQLFDMIRKQIDQIEAVKLSHRKGAKE